ncbi:hypothetical protein NHH82_17640 [Oxalobacteraceae bacterium OTU3REALA1]|nr:hypothetical protein NHH82_17640 [Oxalobacteraceae bacterium OTU3REALA1]
MTNQYRPDVDLIMVPSARLGKLKSWLAREAGMFAVTLPMEVVMDELVYNLLLKSPHGLTLLGTLRYRYTDLDALKAGELSALMEQAQQVDTFELSLFKLAGTLSVPLLTGFTPVPVEGISFVALLGPTLTNLLSSTDPRRRLDMQFNFLGSNNIAGGLLWRPGELRQQVFSILGTRAAPGM